MQELYDFDGILCQPGRVGDLMSLLERRLRRRDAYALHARRRP
jgi:hypothetical protein